jgi:site-specific DNA-methyltransferase (adenine-specific)
MERIILLTTNEGDTVIDPFLGSGTTALAALNTNRKFVGFELDPVYFELAAKRIEKHQNIIRDHKKKT